MTTSSSPLWKSEATPCVLGIEAPRDIPVHRQEVYNAIQRAKAEPMGTAPTE